MANEHAKKCSPCLIIRERNAITTVRRYRLTPVRKAIIQKSTNHPCQNGCGEKGSLLHCWEECTLVQPLWRAGWRLLKKKLKLEPPHDPAAPLLGIHPEKTVIPKGTCTPLITAARLQQPGPGSSLNAHQQRNGRRRCATHLQWDATQPRTGMKQRHLCRCAETWRRHTVTERKASTVKNRLYVESRKMVQVILFTKQKQRHRGREPTHGCQGGK